MSPGGLEPGLLSIKTKYGPLEAQGMKSQHWSDPPAEAPPHLRGSLDT
jgi:hypothetical protein